MLHIAAADLVLVPVTPGEAEEEIAALVTELREAGGAALTLRGRRKDIKV